MLSSCYHKEFFIVTLSKTDIETHILKFSQLRFRAYLKTKIAQKVIICYTRAYLKTKIAQKVIICYTKNR